MRTGVRALLFGLLCCGSMPLLAKGEFTLNGYFRTGTNYSDGLTKGVCYKEGVSAIANPGRFGNECDNLLELVAKTYVFGSPQSTAPWVTVNVTSQLFFAGDRDEERVTSDEAGRLYTGNETIFHFPNTFVEMGNVLGQDAVIWVGRRWYRRIMFYQTDVFALNNNGNGFGVYDINAGPGKLHLALMRRIENQEVTTDEGTSVTQAGPTYNTFDARYSTEVLGLPLEFIYLYQVTGEQDAYGETDRRFESGSGNLYALFSEYWGEHSNRFFLGYGDGLFGQGANYHLGDGLLSYTGFGLTQQEWKAKKKAFSFRFIDELGLTIAPDLFNLNLSVLYSQVKNYALEATDSLADNYDYVDGYNYAFGIKPQIFLNRFFSLVVDLSHTFQERDDYAEARKLNKGTIGTVIRPQIQSLPGVAEFRLYATRASWNQDANYPGDKGSELYASKGQGSTYGVQVDVSW